MQYPGGWGKISHWRKEGRRDAEEPFDQGGGFEGPRQVLGDVETQKLEAGDTLNLCFVDTDEMISELLAQWIHEGWPETEEWDDCSQRDHSPNLSEGLQQA